MFQALCFTSINITGTGVYSRYRYRYLYLLAHLWVEFLHDSWISYPELDSVQPNLNSPALLLFASQYYILTLDIIILFCHHFHFLGSCSKLGRYVNVLRTSEVLCFTINIKILPGPVSNQGTGTCTSTPLSRIFAWFMNFTSCITYFLNSTGTLLFASQYYIFNTCYHYFILRPTPFPLLPACSVGSTEPRTGLRPIIIDGSNVAMSHGRSNVFSVKGIQIVVGYFRLDLGRCLYCNDFCSCFAKIFFENFAVAIIEYLWTSIIFALIRW